MRNLLSPNVSTGAFGTVRIELRKNEFTMICTKCDEEMEHGLWDFPKRHLVDVCGWKCHECGDIFTMKYKFAKDEKWRS